MKMRTYHGQIIRECAWAGNPHGGRWLVQTYHDSGPPLADEECPHYRTLAQAKEGILRVAAFTQVAYEIIYEQVRRNAVDGPHSTIRKRPAKPLGGRR